MTEAVIKKSFWREWGILIGFAVFAVAAIGAFRMWTEYKAEQPIVEPYKRYLNELAAASPGATAFLQQYRAVHRRDSVASMHYPHMCGAMTRLAEGEGVDPGKIDPGQAPTCSHLGKLMPEQLVIP
ncbi:hypothetical protein ACFJIX_19510 [Roseateles sp. UC29_93]|uniref:hypothetical protein n=1 Tax=Roseateles sp. UC29_93 TaxID=3350177 RepID=UPI0036709045